jgi:hypothetical protein
MASFLWWYRRTTGSLGGDLDIQVCHYSWVPAHCWSLSYPRLAESASSLSWLARTAGPYWERSTMCRRACICRPPCDSIQNFSFLLKIACSPYNSHNNWRIKQSPSTVPQTDGLRHCCHHLSAVQPSAQFLTFCLPWTRALFAMLGLQLIHDKDAWGWILEVFFSISRVFSFAMSANSVLNLLWHIAQCKERINWCLFVAGR